MYADAGLEVWGIGPGDDYGTLVDFVDYVGAGFPVLYDEGGAVWAQYAQETAFDQTIFPQEWLIDADGRVAYVANAYDPEALTAQIEAALGVSD